VGNTALEVPVTVPTPLLMVKVVAVPPVKVQDNVEDWPEVIEAGVAVKELTTGKATAEFTVTVTDRVTLPALLEAVRAYVVVAIGDTALEVPVTVPTPLLMVKVVGAPPDNVQPNVEDWPEVIEAGVAVKDPITGATTVGVTVTVTFWLTVPALFVAVSV
jgi:hypothetical protein